MAQQLKCPSEWAEPRKASSYRYPNLLIFFKIILKREKQIFVARRRKVTTSTTTATRLVMRAGGLTYTWPVTSGPPSRVGTGFDGLGTGLTTPSTQTPRLVGSIYTSCDMPPSTAWCLGETRRERPGGDP